MLEMTTNTWELYDELLAPRAFRGGPASPSCGPDYPLRRSSTTRSQPPFSARLLAKGLLVSISVPRPRSPRTSAAPCVAQRRKTARLATQAKNRLHALLPATSSTRPGGAIPSRIDQTEWWLALPLGKLEKSNLQSDLDALPFAESQLARLTSMMKEIGAKDDQVTHLVHFPGFGVVAAVTVLAAITVALRTALKTAPASGWLCWVGRCDTSIQACTTRTGRITKAGRRDLRTAMVEAAQVAANSPSRIGTADSRDWNRIWDVTRRSWLLLANCSSPLGLSCPGRRQDRFADVPKSSLAS